MGSPLYILETVVVLGAMFTLLVAAHELGHYLLARYFNMGVEEFAIGFGKRPIFEWMKRTYEIPIRTGEVASIVHSNPSAFDLEGSGKRPAEDMVEVDTPSGKVLRETTRFTVRAWPLGGFVRIKGMLPEEDGSETKIAGGFYSKPPMQRWVVLLAGPLFSILAGMLILVPMFMFEGIKPNNKPVLGPLAATGAAKKAGLREGDRIVSVDGKPISTFYQIIECVRAANGKSLDIDVNRSGSLMHFAVAPQFDKEETPVITEKLEMSKPLKAQWKLGVSFTTDPVPFPEAVKLAGSYPVMAVLGLVDIVVHPSTFKDQVGGPLAITTTTYDTVKYGISQILKLAAVLSISIGVLNLLPVAPLDGGQMMLAFAEFIKGRRLSIQFQSTVTMVGFAFMIVLIVSVCFVDISKMLDNGKAVKEPPPVKATK